MAEIHSDEYVVFFSHHSEAQLVYVSLRESLVCSPAL